MYISLAQSNGNSHIDLVCTHIIFGACVHTQIDHIQVTLQDHADHFIINVLHLNIAVCLSNVSIYVIGRETCLLVHHSHMQALSLSSSFSLTLLQVHELV